jgi:regulator of protease activity HflC (stomatin/prohibitin superfamily)
VFATVWLILLVIVFFAALVTRWRLKSAEKRSERLNESVDSDDFESGSYAPAIALVVACVTGLLFVVSLIFSVTYTQDQGEAVVIRSWSGKVTGEDITPGLGLKMPWENTVKFDVRNVVIEFVNKSNDEIGQDGPAITAPLSGSSNATVNFTSTIAIEPSCVGEIYAEYKSEANFRSRRLIPVVRDQVRNASTAYDPFKIKERREALGEDVRLRLEKEWETDCVIIQDINLGEIGLDPDTEGAITQVNVSRQKVEAARNSLEESKIQAEEQRVDAQAQADSDQIIRCGAVSETVTEIIGGEEQEVTVINPKSGDECENVLNEQVLTAKWLDVLTQLGAQGNVTIVVPNDPNGGLDLQPRIDLPVNSPTAGAEGD